MYVTVVCIYLNRCCNASFVTLHHCKQINERKAPFALLIASIFLINQLSSITSVHGTYGNLPSLGNTSKRALQIEWMLYELLFVFFAEE